MQSAKSKASVSCSSCSATTLTRNHYFTGKLMVERDFTDEQRYFRERLRLHNQRLHGTGVACGLRVRQHDNPACQDRYLMLDPGSAIDCCGNDILVTETDTLDLRSFAQVKALLDAPDDGKDHVLRVCIGYRDCPTEEIPVLYDECACDDSQCAPNRILETYDIDVLVDPPADEQMFAAPELDRRSTLGLAAADAVVVDDAGARVFVMSDGDTGAIYQFSASTEAVETSFSLGRKGLALALAPDATRLFVVVAPTTASGDSELWAFDVSGPTTLASGPTGTAAIGSSGNSAPSLVVSQSGQLVAGFPGTKTVFAWKAPVAASVPPNKITLTDAVTSLVCASDGNTAYVSGSGSNALRVIDLTASTLTSKTITVPGTDLASLALVASSGPDLLVAADPTSSMLHLIDLSKPSGTPPTSSAALASPPKTVVVSPDGAWAYVDLETDAVQVVDVDALRGGASPIASTPFPIGPKTRDLAISATGARLFVAYEGSAPDSSDGGVAVIDIHETDCGSVLHQVRPCPDCGRGDCVVLATVRGYRPGRRLLDEVDPAPSAAADAAAAIARIDDLDGRTILASTQTLQQVIECLLDHGTGGVKGAQGPPGDPGKNGSDGAPGAAGAAGKDGVGLDTGIGRIVGASWKHAAAGAPFVAITTAKGDEVRGLILAFSHDVHIAAPATKANRRTVFRVSILDPRDDGLLCHCPIDGQVLSVVPKFDASDKTLVVSATEATTASKGLAFIPDAATLKSIARGAEIWIELLGDFVIDSDDNAIDAEFVRARFPTGDRRKAPLAAIDPDKLRGIPGGRFDSWLTYETK